LLTVNFNAECTFIGTPRRSSLPGKSLERGGTKGYLSSLPIYRATQRYINELEHHIHRRDALLGSILATHDPRAQSLIADLAVDPLGRSILQDVDVGPFGPAGKAKVKTYWEEYRGSELSIGGKEGDMASIANQGDIGKLSPCFQPLRLLLLLCSMLISHYIFTEAGSFLPIYKWQDRLVSYLNFTHVRASTDKDPYPGNSFYTVWFVS
jgi:hypothetical protein